MRNLTVILATLLTLALAGCGEEASQTSSEPAAEESTTSETQTTETDSSN